MRPDPQDLRELEAVREHRGEGRRALCHAPWLQLVFWPDGDVTVCCASQPQPLGNIAETRLPDLWQGRGIEVYRRMLAANEFPEGCVVCHNDLAAGRRQGLLLREMDGYDLGAGTVWPQKLEFSMSNTCNLTCIMCNGMLSSGIRSQQGLPPLPKVYGDQFFADLAAFLPHLRTAAFKGGEPFVEAECRRVWEMLIDARLRPTCSITTNGSIYDERVERVLHELPCNLSISVDGVTSATVERIRRNSRFDVLMANLRRFNAYAHGDTGAAPHLRARRLQLNYTVQRLNWRETADFFLLAEDLDATVWYALVHGPDHCSLLTLPVDELRHVVVALEAESARIEERLLRNRETWRELLRELRSRLEARGVGVGQGGSGRRGASPLQHAVALHQRGETQPAIAAAQLLQPGHEDYARAQGFLGGLFTDLGQLPAAEAALQAAARAAPDSVEVPLRLSWLRAQQGDLVAARVELANGRRIAETLAAAPVEVKRGLLFVEAHLRMREGDPAGALPFLERLLASDPDHAGGRELYRQARQLR